MLSGQFAPESCVNAAFIIQVNLKESDMLGRALVKAAQWSAFSLVFAAYVISVAQFSGV
jgi:hypothetical protein